MVRQHQTSDVQLHIGESRDSGFDVLHRPRMTSSKCFIPGTQSDRGFQKSALLDQIVLEDRHLELK
jgi:hypothetical protein